MNAQDIYIKRTYQKNKVVISQHRVWHAEKFVAAQQEQARKDSESKPEEGYKVSLSTEQEYKAAH